jgi:hypothetical protein
MEFFDLSVDDAQPCEVCGGDEFLGHMLPCSTFGCVCMEDPCMEGPCMRARSGRSSIDGDHMGATWPCMHVCRCKNRRHGACFDPPVDESSYDALYFCKTCSPDFDVVQQMVFAPAPQANSARRYGKHNMPSGAAQRSQTQSRTPTPVPAEAKLEQAPPPLSALGHAEEQALATSGGLQDFYLPAKTEPDAEHQGLATQTPHAPSQPPSHDEPPFPPYQAPDAQSEHRIAREMLLEATKEGREVTQEASPPSSSALPAAPHPSPLHSFGSAALEAPLSPQGLKGTHRQEPDPEPGPNEENMEAGSPGGEQEGRAGPVAAPLALPAAPAPGPATIVVLEEWSKPVTMAKIQFKLWNPDGTVFMVNPQTTGRFTHERALTRAPLPLHATRRRRLRWTRVPYCRTRLWSACSASWRPHLAPQRSRSTCAPFPSRRCLATS